jgi:hypothetical protein
VEVESASFLVVSRPCTTVMQVSPNQKQSPQRGFEITHEGQIVPCPENPFKQQGSPQQIQQEGYPSQQIQQVQTVDALSQHESLLVMQLKPTRGYCQMMMGSQPNFEFRIASKVNPRGSIFYALEEEQETCCTPFCFVPDLLHPFTINLFEDYSSRDPIASFERPLMCGVAPCKICCYQQLKIFKAGVPNGSIKEDFSCGAPSFKVLQPNGTHQFDIYQPTCCCGMCVDYTAEGCYCLTCRHPFYIFPPGASGAVGSQTGKIVKVKYLFPFSVSDSECRSSEDAILIIRPPLNWISQKNLTLTQSSALLELCFC